MSESKAFDDDGNEMVPCEINSLCPIERRADASQIALDYFLEVEKCKATFDQMFTTLLGPTGSQTATHVWCPRRGYTTGLAAQIQRMKDQNQEWVGSREYTLDDDHAEILSKFVCLTDNADDVLSSLGLEIIRIKDTQ